MESILAHAALFFEWTMVMNNIKLIQSSRADPLLFCWRTVSWLMVQTNVEIIILVIPLFCLKNGSFGS